MKAAEGIRTLDIHVGNVEICILKPSFCYKTAVKREKWVFFTIHFLRINMTKLHISLQKVDGGSGQNSRFSRFATERLLVAVSLDLNQYLSRPYEPFYLSVELFSCLTGIYRLVAACMAVGA